MRRRKRVVDKDIAERGEAAGELAVVVFFLGMKAGVFQAKNIAVLHRGDGFLRRRPDAILGKGHRLFDDPRHRGGDGFERILGIAALRPVEMREQNDLAALAGELGNGRGDLFDAGCVGDLAVGHRHVEVDAHQHAFSFDVGVVE